ncbi:MAG: 2-C-methyl-D-erythritol 4-phosphate cytidylyltransferase [Ignavibacteria bacterium]|jgi:2-C-methyl-D-erythritol 4-phosphate cytidylyltransferase
MKTYAIIPAGGKGIRSGKDTPKQYLKFKGKELIVYTLEVFQESKLINAIVISAESKYFDLLQNLKERYKLTKITSIVEGGDSRQDSVFNGIKSINGVSKDDLIVVHDAARPLLPQSVLANAIEEAKSKGNALVCVKAKDTLIKGDTYVENYVDRNEIYYVQTPQIFPYSVMNKAMLNAERNKFTGTDESMLVRQIGEKVNIVEGSVYNFKVTTTEDLAMFEKLI